MRAFKIMYIYKCTWYHSAFIAYTKIVHDRNRLYRSSSDAHAHRLERLQKSVFMPPFSPCPICCQKYLQLPPARFQGLN